MSLISDFVSPRRRGIAMATWSAGGSAGVFLGFALGGFVNETVGWRNTFIIAGVPGLVLALVILLTLREPKRGATDPEKAAISVQPTMTLSKTIAHLWKIRIYRQTILTAAACNVATFALLAWAPPLAVRVFNVGSGEAGSLIGTGILLAVGSAIAWGVICDWLGRKGLAWPAAMTIIPMTAAAILLGAALFAQSFHAFAILFALGYACLQVYSPIMWVVLLATTPPEMRASATANMLLTSALLASVPAPLLVGIASDALNSSMGIDSLRYALLLVPGASVVAALGFALVARTIAGSPNFDRQNQAARAS